MKKETKSSLENGKIRSSKREKETKRGIQAGKIHSFALPVAEKKTLEGVGRPSGGVAFVDEMGEPKLISARIGGARKTRKPSKSAQNSILLFQEAPPYRCGKISFESFLRRTAAKRRIGFRG